VAACMIWMVRTWAGGSSSNGEGGVLDMGEITKVKHFTLSLSSSSSHACFTARLVRLAGSGDGRVSTYGTVWRLGIVLRDGEWDSLVVDGNCC
jgi:hypothetical protein